MVIYNLVDTRIWVGKHQFCCIFLTLVQRLRYFQDLLRIGDPYLHNYGRSNSSYLPIYRGLNLKNQWEVPHFLKPALRFIGIFVAWLHVVQGDDISRKSKFLASNLFENRGLIPSNASIVLYDEANGPVLPKNAVENQITYHLHWRLLNIRLLDIWIWILAILVFGIRLPLALSILSLSLLLLVLLMYMLQLVGFFHVYLRLIALLHGLLHRLLHVLLRLLLLHLLLLLLLLLKFLLGYEQLLSLIDVQSGLIPNQILVGLV